MATKQIYNIGLSRKFAAPIIRPSEATIRAKRREISVRYRASGYRPTFADYHRANLMKILNDRRIAGHSEIISILSLLENPRKLKALTVGKLIKLTDEERCILDIRTIQPFDISPAEHRANVIAQRRLRQRLFAEKKRREHGAIPREAYRQASLAQQRPWEAMGMSRRTWYRQGKPAPPRGTSASGFPIKEVTVECCL